MARRGFATRSSSRACRWTPWGWTSTTSARTSTRPGGRSTAKTTRRASNGPATCCTSFKHEGYEAAWNAAAGAGDWRCSTRRAAADQLLNYVSERREMIRYPDFQAKGWQIGSGPTEATCKTLTARLKGSGMRWDGDNAEAIMALEALNKAANGTNTGEVSYGQRVKFARKFCRTLRHEPQFFYFFYLT